MANKAKAKQVYSIKEKASTMTGKDGWRTVPLNKSGAEVNSVRMSDGPCGLRNVADPSTKGVPMKATLFPAPCLTACSWDPEVIYEVGKMMALEAIDQHIDVILAPGVNVKRNPLCGRNFEYLSEDPYLSGHMGASFIGGVQSQGVGACLKHFAVNNQEFRRFTYSAEVDDRALREIYLTPFEIAVKDSDPWMVMEAYNRVNGIQMAQHSFLLKDVLRDEWKYKGVVVSDWGAVNDIVASHAHGLDIEMPGGSGERASLLAKAVRKGKISEETFESSFEHICNLAKKAKARQDKKVPAYEYELSHDVAIVAASESMILAKNEDKILPLKNFDDVCVIGGLAKEPLYQGKGSSQVNARNKMNFLEAAPRYLKKKSSIPYAQGYRMRPDDKIDDLHFEAMDLAGQHENVILFLGLNDEHWSEGYDRDHMRLPDEQYQLFDLLYKENPNIIVVVSTGAPVELPFLDRAKAVVLTYMAGEAFGEALTSLLVGERNFSGKLAETWPIRYMDVPSAAFYPGSGDTSLYKESIFVGYRYYLTGEKRVAFPFGHGLSYTTFKYSDMKISRKTLTEGDFVEVTFKIKNNGKMAGKEVVECYIEPINNIVMKAKRTLCYFEKVALEKGESKTVTFTIPYRAFCHYDILSESYKAEGGKYLIELASSCEKIQLDVEVEIKSAFKAVNQRFMMPNYFKLGKPGFNVSDEEFETLRDMQKSPRKKTQKKKRGSARFGWNTTMGEIRETFIGKKIIRQYENNFLNSGLSAEAKKHEMDTFLWTPFRFLTLGGISDRTICVLIAMANRQYLRVPFIYLFGKRK